MLSHRISLYSPSRFRYLARTDFGMISDSKLLTSWQVKAHDLRYVTSGEMDRISVVFLFNHSVSLQA